MASLNTNTASGAMRMADALLESLGGTSVALRYPVTAQAGQDAEQLGLGAPAFEDVALAPAVFRRLNAQIATDGTAVYELLVSASAVSAQMALLGLTSVADLFAAGLGIVVRGTLLAVLGVTSSEAFGQAYLYRIRLKGPQGELL
jgi:hypothetical protein